MEMGDIYIHIYICMYVYVIVINQSEAYSGVIELRPEGGSPRIKVLITRLSTESTVYNYYIARGCFRRMLSRDYLITNIYYTQFCHKVKSLLLLKYASICEKKCII